MQSLVLILRVASLSPFLQDKQDSNHFKGDFVFHTWHVVELVAKVLVQVESQNDLSAPVHVSDK